MVKSKLVFEKDALAIVEAKHGYFLYNKNDLFIGRSLECYGEWCEPGLDILLQCATSGGIILDIGANIGTHTVALARKVGTNGRVIAFEPQRMVYQNLCANVSLNRLINVDCLHKGVGEKNAVCNVPIMDPETQQNFGALEISGHKTGEPVEIITIDSLSLQACSLIKVDVEGMENEVLTGANDTIRQFRPLMFVENNNLDKSEELIDNIFAMDYVAWWVIADYYRPSNFFANEKNIFSTSAPSVDLFCVPAEQPVNITGLELVCNATDNWLVARERIVANNRSDDA
ncbi:FkbM family methyltransferase [Alphaproteobacteria bacterium]|nr:FkbM family methyltransferase [Alphaproteobacteria bacterium]